MRIALILLAACTTQADPYTITVMLDARDSTESHRVELQLCEHDGRCQDWEVVVPPGQTSLAVFGLTDWRPVELGIGADGCGDWMLVPPASMVVVDADVCGSI